jgi:O-antigen ligase
MLYISQIDPAALFDLMSELTTSYADEISHRGLVHAVQTAPLGLGTGMNTGPARYAFDDPESFIAVENYYAKAVYELGIPGLFVVAAMFLAIITYGYDVHRQIRDKELRSVSAALLAFIITMTINSFKGWLLDLDPINVYFWLFAGLLFKLNCLHAGQVERASVKQAVIRSNVREPS